MQSAKRRGLGVDPLDALVSTETTEPTRVARATETTNAPSVGSVVDKPTTAASRAALKPVKLDGDVLDQVRAAVDWLRHHGEPYATLKAVLERAAVAEVERLAAEHHDGEPFPPVSALPRGGRQR